MTQFFVRTRRCLAALATLSLTMVGSGAQAAPADAAAQEAAFQAMLATPGDIGAMLAYARASVKIRDYEAAVATLERLLDLRPEMQEARLELAVAYHALGAYAVARYHFDQLEQQGALGTNEARLAARYVDAGAARSTPDVVKGHVAAGLSYSDDREAFGGTVQFGFRWRHDMGDANTTVWQTDARAALFAFEGEGLDLSSLLLRSGPWLSLDGTAYGAKVRPYLELSATWDADDEDRGTAALGLQYSNTHNAFFSSFADVKLGRSFGFDGGANADFLAGALGVTYRPTRDTRLRFALRASDRVADVALDSRSSHGARLDLSHEVAVGFDASDRKWRLSAHGAWDRIDWRNAGRMDDVWSVGVGLRAYVKDDLFVQTGLRHIDRDSSDDALDSRANIVSLMIGMEF